MKMIGFVIGLLIMGSQAIADEMPDPMRQTTAVCVRAVQQAILVRDYSKLIAENPQNYPPFALDHMRTRVLPGMIGDLAQYTAECGTALIR